MKLTDINSESIKKVDDKELVSLHRRVHQLYILANRRASLDKKIIDFLIETHNKLVVEMERRGMKHNTPLSTKDPLSTYLKDVSEED